ncbi:WYL domain-containing protein [Denitratimonas sp. CY0512]|uniref:helix-turn-helix transcriptional regulator n=1 Tax=Denitratimonas sp. CY0512 TaxID=3131940 RepID=UPI0030959700
MSDTTLRYLETLRAIPRHPRKITAGEVHAHLLGAGFEIGDRSVERDLHKLSTRYPIVCDEGVRPAGWCWRAGAADLIAPGLTTGEALELELLARYLKPLLPSGAWASLQPRLSAAKATLKTLADAPLARWRKRVAVIGDGPPLQVPEIASQVLATVHEGLLRNCRIVLDYRAVEAEKPRRYEVNPVALVYMGQVGYLVAMLWEYDDLRLLALHRMSQPELLDTPARQAKDFDLSNYLREQSPFDFPGSEEWHLQLRVHGWLARHLEERRLSKDQRIEPNGDDADTAIVRATVRESERMVWWLRSHGPAVEVLEPAALRQRLAEDFAALAACYSKASK